jgi:hypothetical protein
MEKSMSSTANAGQQAQQTPQGQQANQAKTDNMGSGDAGDILQASTTVAGLAVALVAFLPSSSMTSIKVLQIGGLGLSLGTALLLCGTLAITSSIWTLNKIQHDVGLSFRALLMFKTHPHLSFLFYSLAIFVIVYIGVISH